MSRTIKTEAEFGGKPCEGESSIEETCNIRECPGIKILYTIWKCRYERKYLFFIMTLL